MTKGLRSRVQVTREMGTWFLPSLGLQGVLDGVFDLLARLAPYDFTLIQWLDEAGTLELTASRGFPILEQTRLEESCLSDPALNWLRERGKALVVRDTRANGHWGFLPWGEQVRSWACAALRIQDERVGLLAVGSRQPCAYKLSFKNTLQAFTDQAAVAIANARALEREREARRRAETACQRAETLHQVTADLDVGISLEEALQKSLEQLNRLVPYDRGCLMLVEWDKIVLKARHLSAAMDEPVLSVGTSFDLQADPIYGEVVHTGEPLSIPNVQRDARWNAARMGSRTGSWMGIPLWARGQVIGLFSLDRLWAGGFAREEIRLAQAFASHASTLIQNIRMSEAEEQRAAELLAVRQASLCLTSSLDLGSVLDSILENTLRFLPGAQYAHIYLYHLSEEAGDYLAFGAGLWKDGRRGGFLPEPRPQGLTYTVARSGQSYVITDIEPHPLFADLPPTERRSGAMVGTPLKMNQRVVGVMNVYYPQPRQFLEAELRVLYLLGEQAAIAIENAQLYQREAAERRHLRLLYDVGRELTSSLDQDVIIKQAVALVCQALDGLIGSVYLYDSDKSRLRLSALYGRNAKEWAYPGETVEFTLGKGLVGWVAQTHQAECVPDVEADPRWLRIPGLHDGVHSAIFAPILDHDRLMGVFAVLHGELGVYHEDHVYLLQAICQQVSLALNNARRYQQVQNLVDMLVGEQHRLESLVEHLPVGVMLLDAEYWLLVANPQARHILTRLNKEEPSGELSHLGPCPVSELIEHQKDPFLLEIPLPEEPRLVVEAAARPIEGNPCQWVIVIRDVTQERENQERLNIQDRLATVGQLAAGIAHDFNNIMAAIMVYAELLGKDSSLLPENRERLRIIQQQVQYASSLIHQILDFSRRSVMEQAPMDLLPFLKEFSKLLSRVLPETIRLKTCTEPDEYLVKADPVRLQHVFMNLALNARDAMPEGGMLSFEMGRLEVLPGVQPPYPDLTPGEWIRIRVRDTGCGIPPEIMPRIFDPFFTTKPVGQGTGLGLSQAYGILRLHGGFIGVESKVGEGTCFTLYLPVLRLPQQEEQAREAGGPPVEGQGIRILVVEDDPTTRDALKALLQEDDFSVVSAANGVEALKVLAGQDGRVRCMISDLVMPEMGGMELYQVVRERYPEVKMLFFTGHPLGVNDRALLDQGEVRCLRKPFSAQDFNAAVQSLIN